MAKRGFDRATMVAAVKRLYPKAKDPSDEVTNDQLADALRKKFAKVKEDDLADCEECGESSPAEGWDACPFCGEGGVEEPKVIEEDEEDEEDLPSSDGRAETDDGDSAAASDEEPPKRKRNRSKKTAAKKTTKLTKDPAKLAKLEEKLDESVRTIRQLQKDMLANGFDLGRELIKVFDSESWKARRADGKAAHPSFKSWCLAECGFTPQMARNYMSAAKEFDRQQYTKLGVSKLAVIAKLPPAKRQPVINAALEGADLKTIQAKVSAAREKIREASGDGKRGPGRPVGATSKLTAVVKLSKEPTALAFYAKDPGEDGAAVELERWEPGAWAGLDLGGGVMLHIQLRVEKKIATGLLVTFSRRTSTAAETTEASAS